MSPRLLLASASPRRLALLKQIIADTKIEVLVSAHLEEQRDNEDPIERVQRLALEKARQVMLRRQDFSPSIEIVIGADTEIVLDGRVVGQPEDAATARKILQELSGHTHQATTGLALIRTRDEHTVVRSVSTAVKFKSLSDDEIEAYIQTGEPIGKAGAYGIQGLGALFIEEIDGSYSNVVGLPLECLSELLDREFGLPVWHIDKTSNWSLGA
jgi:septum formation protein